MTANIYMANEIERRYGSRSLHATSLIPGANLTPLQQHLDSEVRERFLDNKWLMKVIVRVEQGMACSARVAVGKSWEEKRGVLENLAVSPLRPALPVG